MKTNCELPIQLLPYNNILNDYDFVLFHLLDIPEYKQFFLEQRKKYPFRKMILDNSAYEYFIRGKELDLDKFEAAIDELSPDFFILPDVLMDMPATLSKFFEFKDKFPHYFSGDETLPRPMGVLQGNSWNEFSACVNAYYGNGVLACAIPFHNTFFKETEVSDAIKAQFLTFYPQWNDDLAYAAGRVQQMSENIHNLALHFDYIHMLGSHCPLEKVFYEHESSISSMDTGYPVKLGICDLTLLKEKAKPNIIIDDFLQESLKKRTINAIFENVGIFKSL